MTAQGRTIRHDTLPATPPEHCILALAGVEPRSFLIGRWLLIDPPATTIDALAERALDALGSGADPSAVAAAIVARLSRIERVQGERDRLVVRLVGEGIGFQDAVRIADSWIDYGVRAQVPERRFRAAIIFSPEGRSVDALVEIVRSSRVRQVVYVGGSTWTRDIKTAGERADLVDFLCLQVLEHAESDSDHQLLKFELARNSSGWTQIQPSADDHPARWQELADALCSPQRHRIDAQQLRNWSGHQVTADLGYRGAPWLLASGGVGPAIWRPDRTLAPLNRDATISVDGPADPFWLTATTEGFAEMEWVKVARLKNLRGNAAADQPLDRMVRTRDASGRVRPLEDLSDALRNWIYDRLDRFVARAAGVSPNRDEPWWSSPNMGLPGGPFVALPVISRHGRPTVFAPGTATGSRILRIQPRRLDVEALAALLTAGPVRDRLLALCPRDERGNPNVNLDALAALRVPKRIHPLIQDDLVWAYRNGDVDAMARLGTEVVSG
ncbi:MAG: hypothetical protein HKN24_07655 [Acidimicrobiales bacterium]|nr:hypothetical protein [Acidimicrobiales bacterium]